MSLKKAQQFYQSLTKTQQHFVETKLINDTMKVEQWLKFLTKASDYDAYTDTMEAKYRKGSNNLMGLAVFLTFISFFALVAGLWFLMLVPLVLYFLAFRRKRAMRRMQEHDLHNTLRLLFLPLLKVLTVKAGPQAKMSANLNFRDPRKALDPKKYKDGRGRNVKRYRPTYIISKVRLLDGGILELVVADELYDLDWTKRSASGKTKYKRKNKTVHHTFVKLTVSKENYRLNEGVTLPENVAIEETAETIIVKCKDKQKIASQAVLGADPVLALLQSVYQAVERTDGGEAMVEEGAEDQKLPLPASVWERSYFDEYDMVSMGYYSTMYDYDDDDHVNVFDS